jgi:hypothetical protein
MLNRNDVVTNDVVEIIIIIIICKIIIIFCIICRRWSPNRSADQIIFSMILTFKKRHKLWIAVDKNTFSSLLMFKTYVNIFKIYRPKQNLMIFLSTINDATNALHSVSYRCFSGLDMALSIGCIIHSHRFDKEIERYPAPALGSKKKDNFYICVLFVFTTVKKRVLLMTEMQPPKFQFTKMLYMI